MRRVACHLARRIKAIGQQILGKVKRSGTTRSTKKVLKDPRLSATPDSPIHARAIEQRYAPLRPLGAGGNGEVHLCRDTKMGTLIAVKTVDHEKPSMSPLEAEILHFLSQHTNIVRYHTVLKDPSQDFYIQLVFEYCELGDLADYVNSAIGDVTPEMFIWSAFKQISSGLHFVHRAGVVHGDLKTDNILVCPPPSGSICPILKIGDFGAATVNPPRDFPLGHFGTIGFQPPEVIMRHGPESDIWALGCIIYQLATRRLPYLETAEPQIDSELWFERNELSVPDGTPAPSLYKRTCHYMAFRPPAPKRIDQWVGYSKLLNYLMMRALDTNYHTRITIYELHRSIFVLEKLAHDLFLSGQDSNLNRFDDGRDAHWKHMSIVTDSTVYEHIFLDLALRAHHERRMELLMMATPLLEIMKFRERLSACRYVPELIQLQRD
jgi:serine/threonine protein kinase